MAPKRFKDQIVLKILQVWGASKTQIVYKSGLNFHTIVPYMEILTHRGLLVLVEGEIPLYRTTKKGETALGHLRELERLIWEDVVGVGGASQGRAE